MPTLTNAGSDSTRMDSPSDTWFKRFLLFLTVVLVYVGLANLKQRKSWAMSDWAINFSGGFIRRGLPGQVARTLGHFTHVSPFLFLLLMQWCCYGIIFWSIWRLVRGLAWPLWMKLLIYSPATLAFVFWDPTDAFRKEILLFALLGLIIVPLSHRNWTVWHSLALALAVFGVILSHEALIIYMPYLFCALLLGLQNVRKAALGFLPAAAAILAAAFLATTHHGTVDQALTVCRSIGGTDLHEGLCESSIQYLSRDAAYARLDVLSHLSLLQRLSFIPIAALALIPIVFALRHFWGARRGDVLSIAVCALSSWIASIGLFLYAVDWNRWIYIHVMCSMFLLLMLNRNAQREGTLETSWRLPQPVLQRTLAVLFLAFYFFGWQLYIYNLPRPYDMLIHYSELQTHGLRKTFSRKQLQAHAASTAFSQ